MAVIDDIWPEESFYTRSDHYNFAQRGVPILFFFNGTHDQYHQPADEVELIDYDKMARLARLELSADELERFIAGIARGDIPDYQATAFLMAVYLKGLSDDLVVAMTLAMRDSGVVIEHPDVTTLAGLVMALSGTIPDAGTAVTAGEHELVVEERSGRKLSKIRIRPVASATDD